jgi:hypothetical protein
MFSRGAVVKFLTDGAACVPDRIVNIAQEALSAPQGAAMRTMLEGMQAQMNAAHAGNTLNPLGHVPSALAAPPQAAAWAPTPGAHPANQSGGTGAVGNSPGAGGGESLNLESLRAALVRLDQAPVEIRRACLTTAAKLGQNIVENPGEAKFRKVRAANGAFNKKVLTPVRFTRPATLGP